MAHTDVAVQLRHLRYFLAVAETRNVSRAAALVHVAQPALSRQVRDLERTLDVPLFVRRPKGMELTAAGETVARVAPGLLAELGAAIDRAEATAGGRRGGVVLGALRAYVAGGFAITVQEELRREQAAIALTLQDIDPPDLLDALRAGGIDVALTMDRGGDEDLNSIALWDETVDMALLPAGHGLAHRRTLTVPELGGLPLVLGQRAYTPALVEHALNGLRGAGLVSSLLAVDAGLQAVHFAVAAGRGWTLVSRARAVAAPAGTAAIPLDGFAMTVPAVAVWRRGEHRPVVRTVLGKVLEVARRNPAHHVEDDVDALPRAANGRVRPGRRPGSVPPVLEVRHLRALLEVTATQTIGRAAERLGLTQPSLSRQLKELEHAIGVPLLARSARGVQLTAAGASFAGECPGMLRSLDQLAHEVGRTRRGMEGRCVVGAVATGVTSEILGRTLVQCTARFPDVHLLIEELPTPALPDALLDGRIDLGLGHAFLRLEPGGAVVRRCLVRDRVSAALVASNHPLAMRQRLTASDLADVPFVFVARAFYPPLYDRIVGALRTLGMTPVIEGTYDGLQSIWAMVARGKGWAIGFRSQLMRPPVGTAAVPLAGFDVPWGIDVVHRADETRPAVLAVARVMRRVRGRER